MTLTVATDVEQMQEAALLSAAQRGDAQALEALVRLHRSSLAAQVAHMTGDPGSVDDIVQEVFIAAVAALPGFRRDAQLGTWLYRIALNKSRTWWKAQQRRKRREQLGTAVAQAQAETPDEQLAHTDHARRLYAALADLPHRYREAFVARHVEGMELAQASEHLGAPVSTVSYRARRAMALLEQRLCEDDR